MNTSNKDQYIQQICHNALLMLDHKKSLTIRDDKAQLINGQSCTFSLSINHIDQKHIVLNEQIIPLSGKSYSSFHWVFELAESWRISDAVKNDLEIENELIDLEISSLHGRIDAQLKSEKLRFEVPIRSGNPVSMTAVMKHKSSRVFTLAAAGLIMAGLFLTIFISTMQYGRMLKTVLTLNDSINSSSELNSNSITLLSSELNRINHEISDLKEEVSREKEAFDFNKQQTAMNLRWLASRFPRSSYSRARAYEYLADRIDDSLSYGEMVYQLSRLPENNAQAETLIATDKENYHSMSNYNPVFYGLLPPVNTNENRDADKKSFMVSSGFIEHRLSPLGYGGVKPHLAIDVINLDNIVRISEDNEIIRDHSQPGFVQSVASGKVLHYGFDWVYGWSVELRHEVDADVKALYPHAEFWTSYYAHMEEGQTWDSGESVSAGQVLGKIGNTGKSTGPHLHYEIRVYSSLGDDQNDFGSFQRINPFIKQSKSQE